MTCNVMRYRMQKCRRQPCVRSSPFSDRAACHIAFYTESVLCKEQSKAVQTDTKPSGTGAANMDKGRDGDHILADDHLPHK